MPCDSKVSLRLLDLSRLCKSVHMGFSINKGLYHRLEYCNPDYENESSETAIMELRGLGWGQDRDWVRNA